MLQLTACEAPFGAPSFPFVKWEQLCHAKLAACELGAEHLADQLQEC